MTGWRDLDALLEGWGIRVGNPTSGQTTGGRHTDGSHHYTGTARDYGRSTSDADRIARALEPYAQGENAPIRELFYSPLGIFYDEGRRFTPSDKLRRGHFNHVHVAVDQAADFVNMILNPSSAAAATAPVAGDERRSPLGSGLTGTIARYAVEGAMVAGGVGLVVLGVQRTGHKGAAA